jgi:rRNA biogenesis protein RRP5
MQCVVKAIDKTRAIVHLSSDEDLLSKSTVWQINIKAI